MPLYSRTMLHQPLPQVLFSSSLIQLAALGGGTLGGPTFPDVPITSELCALAARHQVCPFLYSVAAAGRHDVAGTILEELHTEYSASRLRRQAALAQLER